jgi:hypothetical protein
MLPLILASLLAAGSFDNVQVDTSILGPVKVLDTAAADCDGPLRGKTWGLGFRVLGDAPEILIHGALGSRTSLSLQGIFRGSSLSESEQIDKLDGDSSLLDIELSAVMRVRYACQERLCATVGIGLMFRGIESDGLHYYAYQDTSHWSLKTTRSEARFGVTSSLGATAEVLPGLFLVSEFGMKLWFASVDHTVEYNYPGSSFGRPERKTESFDIANKDLSTWFGGIGLDYWF